MESNICINSLSINLLVTMNNTYKYKWGNSAVLMGVEKTLIFYIVLGLCQFKNKMFTIKLDVGYLGIPKTRKCK